MSQDNSPVDRDQTPLRAVSRDAMLPVAVCDVQGTVVAGLRECVVEFHVEGVGALHGRSAGDTDAVARVLPRHIVVVIFDGSKNPAIIRSGT